VEPGKRNRTPNLREKLDERKNPKCPTPIFLGDRTKKGGFWTVSSRDGGGKRKAGGVRTFGGPNCHLTKQGKKPELQGPKRGKILKMKKRRVDLNDPLS